MNDCTLIKAIGSSCMTHCHQHVVYTSRYNFEQSAIRPSNWQSLLTKICTKKLECRVPSPSRAPQGKLIWSTGNLIRNTSADVRKANYPNIKILYVLISKMLLKATRVNKVEEKCVPYGTVPLRLNIPRNVVKQIQ